jgi:hypothetical protein
MSATSKLSAAYGLVIKLTIFLIAVTFGKPAVSSPAETR